MNAWYHGVFTKPIPQLHAQGADFHLGSGATAVFILESAVIKGLPFNSVWSIGNGKQIGIEDVLQYMDENFDPDRDSRIKLLYIENIANPDKLLYHAGSLIRKGCRIAAIKAGSSESGSRAASSHTGAIASSDSAVEALFRKAGIVRCFSREELTTVAASSPAHPHGQEFRHRDPCRRPWRDAHRRSVEGRTQCAQARRTATEELKGNSPGPPSPTPSTTWPLARPSSWAWPSILRA
jgi:hypothetical protein